MEYFYTVFLSAFSLNTTFFMRLANVIIACAKSNRGSQISKCKLDKVERLRSIHSPVDWY